MATEEPARVTLPDFARWKVEGHKIAVLTAYDFTMARLLDASGIDCLLVGDSLAGGDAGVCAMLLESSPAGEGTRVTAKIKTPTIGIGAGENFDGQVLVTPDMLGLFDGFRPKFVRRYAELTDTIVEAAARY